MTQSFVQGNHNETVTTGSSLTCAFTSNNATANNLLVYTAIWDSAATNNPTYSDTLNNQIVDSGNGVLLQSTGLFKIQTLCVLACKTGANTLTISFTGATSPSFIGLTVSEFNDNVNTGGWVIDKIASATGASTTPASGNTAATTQATEVIFGWSGGDGNTIVAGTGFTSGETNQTTLTDLSEYKFVTSTGVQNATFTDTPATTINWAAQCVTFYAIGLSLGKRPSTLLLPPMRAKMVGWRGLQRLQAFPPPVVLADTPVYFAPKPFPPQWVRNGLLLLNTAQDISQPETNTHFIPKTFPPQWVLNTRLGQDTAQDLSQPETNTHFIPKQFPPQWILNTRLGQGTAQDLSQPETNTHFIPRQFPLQWVLNKRVAQNTVHDFSQSETNIHWLPKTWATQWNQIRWTLQNPALDVTAASVTDTPSSFAPRSFPIQWSLTKWQLQNPALDVPIGTQQDTPINFCPLQWPNEWKIDLGLVHGGSLDESTVIETNPPWQAKRWSVQWLPAFLLLSNPAVDIQLDTPASFVPLQWQSQWDVDTSLVSGGAEDASAVVVEANPHWIGKTYPYQWFSQPLLRQNPATDIQFVASAAETNTYFVPFQWQSQWDVDVSLGHGMALDLSFVATLNVAVYNTVLLSIPGGMFSIPGDPPS